MGDGTPTDAVPDAVPPTRTDQWPRTRRERTRNHDLPPSRLRRLRADPEAPTRVRVDPEAPTRVRVDPEAPTRVRTGPEAPTRVRPQAATPPTETRRAAPSRGGHFGGAFPAALLNRYEPHQVAGSGTEGTVWQVRRLDGGGDAAVKVTRTGQAMDTELLDHLRDEAYLRHVPRIVDYGQVEHAGIGCDWVAMEYLPVTLADRIAELSRAGRHTDPRATDPIVRELVAMLDFWQRRVARNPVDFKPANILVRPGAGPGQFVIADFGGVAKLTASRSFSPEIQVTVAYMAPEQLAGSNHPAGPWWGLGNVLYELFTGRPRYLDQDGLLLSDEVLQYDLVFSEEVDLSAVTDPRRRLLLQGLFTRNPAHRWQAGQVRQWLDGASPAVVRTQAPAGAAGAGHAHRPVTFLGDPYHAPSVLAWTMLNRSGEAAEWLVDGGARRLLSWLRDDVRDTLFDLHYLHDVDRARGTGRARAAALAVLAFGAAFAPSAVPHYRERPVDAAGLTRIGTEPDVVAVLDELLAASVPAVAARYDCDHPECSGEHCGRLLALVRLPQVVAETDRLARELGGGGRTGDGLTVDERAHAYRLAVWLTVQPEEHARLLARLSPLPAALYRLPLSGRVAAMTALAAAVLADSVARAWGAARRRPADDVRRRWSALRRRAVGADPTTVHGSAALIAAEVLRGRRTAGGRASATGQAGQAGQAGQTGWAGRFGRNGQPGTSRWAGAGRAGRPRPWRAWAATWWTTCGPALPRQAGAALLVLVALALVLWAGALARISVDAGNQLKILPNSLLGGPLRTAGDHAARMVAPQLGAALAAALTLVFFPARVGRGTFALAAAGAGAIGYLRLGPPMTVLKPPPALADRVVTFEGGMGSWSGVAATVGIVLALVLIGRATRLLGPVHAARRRTAAQWRSLADGRAAPVVPVAPSWPRPAAASWRAGAPGARDRAAFALGSTAVLVVLLWATVEVRLAAVGHHRTPASWGTGQTGAVYQAGFTLLLATASVAAALAGPRTARRLFALWILATLLLGAWPTALGPMEALRIPVAEPLYRGTAELWGHSAFWAAILIALPLACLGIQRTIARTAARAPGR
ncbi:hypothetical protein PUR71_31300 [Streptomyces sp. SP17BM10]|uniref:protein kinase domain-containing protein n=1 Tax=Streptomyces sp. SP17BM10 TaxID=3002530 RepID=UPI002E79B848|nr:hypothetical protein [Streptomyces sp. SP17BM10]MEE1787355.1 hypothetical protein [Streptomyces sp. SP17BM10]